MKHKCQLKGEWFRKMYKQKNIHKSKHLNHNWCYQLLVGITAKSEDFNFAHLRGPKFYNVDLLVHFQGQGTKSKALNYIGCYLKRTAVKGKRLSLQ